MGRKSRLTRSAAEWQGYTAEVLIARSRAAEKGAGPSLAREEEQTH